MIETTEEETAVIVNLTNVNHLEQLIRERELTIVKATAELELLRHLKNDLTAGDR